MLQCEHTRAPRKSMCPGDSGVSAVITDKKIDYLSSLLCAKCEEHGRSSESMLSVQLDVECCFIIMLMSHRT